MRKYTVREKLSKKIIKLQKRDRKTHEIVLKKIREICDSYDVEHYKNLMHDLKEEKRVQIGHFVLTFSYDPQTDSITFLDYDHHDKVYDQKRT